MKRHAKVKVVSEQEFNDTLLVQPLLIGPLAHIKHRSAFGFDYYTVDFSRPGALERYTAEENEWWDHYKGGKCSF